MQSDEKIINRKSPAFYWTFAIVAFRTGVPVILSSTRNMTGAYVDLILCSKTSNRWLTRSWVASLVFVLCSTSTRAPLRLPVHRQNGVSSTVNIYYYSECTLKRALPTVRNKRYLQMCDLTGSYGYSRPMTFYVDLAKDYNISIIWRLCVKTGCMVSV